MKKQPPTPHILHPKDLESWLAQSPTDLLLIDVREPCELEIAAFPAKVLHLPLSQYDYWVDELNSKNLEEKKVVVICHSGVRSLNFALWLIDKCFATNVWNLDGGIDAWSQIIDPSIPRY